MLSGKSQCQNISTCIKSCNDFVSLQNPPSKFSPSFWTLMFSNPFLIWYLSSKWIPCKRRLFNGEITWNNSRHSHNIITVSRNKSPIFCRISSISLKLVLQMISCSLRKSSNVQPPGCLLMNKLTADKWLHESFSSVSEMASGAINKHEFAVKFVDAFSKLFRRTKCRQNLNVFLKR